MSEQSRRRSDSFWFSVWIALMALGIVFVRTTCVRAETWPNVCRVNVPDGGGVVSKGSGILAGVDDKYGYVLTNNHVVRERASNAVTCDFPAGGVRGEVVAVEQTWDLSLIRIAKPDKIEPVKFAGRYPGISEVVYHGGFGSNGEFQWAKGEVIRYTKPVANVENTDWFSSSAPSRSGDSGGPIVNEKSELVGILWGSGPADTMGIQIGRVYSFCQCFGPNCSGGASWGGYSQPAQPRPQPSAPPAGPSLRPLPVAPVAPPSQPPAPASPDPSIVKRLDGIDAKLAALAPCQCDPNANANIAASLTQIQTLLVSGGKRLDALEAVKPVTPIDNSAEIQNLADQIAAMKKQPLTLQILDEKGNVKQQSQAYLGGTFQLELVPVSKGK